MARNSEAKKVSKTGEFTIKIAGIVFFVLVPLVLPLYWSGAFQRFLPRQWVATPPSPPTISPAEVTEERLSPEDLLKSCAAHRYSSEIISLDPLVIYINNFTSSQEAEELIDIGSPDFQSSFISRSRGANTLVTGRTSTSAPLPVEHPLVSCILTRARRFLGSMLLPTEPFSIPQLVRYFPSQKYDLHTDFWPEHQVTTDGSGKLFNRVASFFVFLKANCTEGYTYFPLVEPLAGDEELEKWFGGKVVRGEMDGEVRGVKFKPVKGNAVFWVNLDGEGNGDRRVVHAGLPVGEGEKIGLNIWPRKFYGEVEVEKKREQKKWNGKWKE